MTYVVPQVQVFQEFALVQAVTVPELPAHIAGGHAKLIRYSEPDEKPEGDLGQYVPGVETAYLWPERPAGAIVDRSYTKLFIDDALLHYYDSSAPLVGDEVLSLANYTNRIRAGATSFKANGEDYPRADVFLDRDVRTGDVARVRATIGDDTFELCTYVAGFASEVVAAVIDDISAASSNGADDTADIDVVQTDGSENCMRATVGGTASYHGLSDGEVSETYIVRVTQSSVGGNLATAKLSVLSASGTDDATGVVPAAAGEETAIGTRGVQVVFDVEDDSIASCVQLSEDDDISPDDLIIGQEWTVTASQDFTAPEPVIGGTYSGEADDTYIIEITKGRDEGALSASTAAQFSVRTARGVDISGPTRIQNSGTAYAVGTKGLTATFGTTTNLNKNDVWHVPVTAATDGDVRTLILGHNLPQEVLDNGATEVVVDLYIRKNIEVSAERVGSAPIMNWEQSDTEITLATGIEAYDESYTDGGVPVALTVAAVCEYSNLFLEVRYWLQDLASSVFRTNDVSALESDISGPLHPDNPLKWGVYKALQNANGSSVSYTSVCDPDNVEDWITVLSLLEDKREVYGLVPLTRLPTVLGLYQAHVEAQSSPESARWRIAWFNQVGDGLKRIVSEESSSNEDVVLAVVEDDPETSGTQYTRLRVTSGNSDFQEHAVRAGDLVRIHYTDDGFGNETYNEYIIDEVVNEDTLRLQAGPDDPIEVAEKVEIWRSMTANELAADLALTGGFADRRIRMVWPDQIVSDGYTVEGYFLCAALAGLASGVVPHQSLTRVEIAGFSAVPRTTSLFNPSQLNTMAAGGIWIVTQDLVSGDIFTRHAVTTGDTDNILEREDMITRNMDSISYYFLDIYSPYIGTANVTDSTLAMLRAETSAGITVLSSANYVERLGAQLVSGEIEELRPHLVLRDRVLIVLNLELPFPINTIEAHLKLVA